MNNFKLYTNKVPCCGVYCGGCPIFVRPQKVCLGQPDGCEKRKCSSFYKCCILKKGLRFCYECTIFPCYRFKKFAANWKKYGQDLIENQNLLKQYGEKWFIEHYNNKIDSSNEA